VINAVWFGKLTIPINRDFRCASATATARLTLRLGDLWIRIRKNTKLRIPQLDSFLKKHLTGQAVDRIKSKDDRTT